MNVINTSIYSAITATVIIAAVNHTNQLASGALVLVLLGLNVLIENQCTHY